MPDEERSGGEEYVHKVLSPGLHFGKHARFGRHVAIGEGNGTIHVYNSRIHIGGREGQPIFLSPEQQRVAESLLNRFEAMSASVKPVPEKGKV